MHAPQITAAALLKGLISASQNPPLPTLPTPRGTKVRRKAGGTPASRSRRCRCSRCGRSNTRVICFDCLVQIERGDAEGSRLLDVVCRVFDVRAAEIRSHSRLMHFTEARQVLAYCLVELCGWGWSRTGRVIGRDHGAVRHEHRRIADLMEMEAALKEKVQRVIEEFSRGTKPKAGACARPPEQAPAIPASS